ncbi:hypothetical protein PUF88_03010 [Lactobacillaceae bacterium L1_55_11]|nr:hypothetical protein [Lactobacillaceae bacterium L1_55_11]
MSQSKYKTEIFTGVVVNQDANGQYQPEVGSQPHQWRTGKHTRGHCQELGQIFLTEANQAVAVISRAPLAFKDRHQFQPLKRWTSAQVPLTTLSPWLSE